MRRFVSIRTFALLASLAAVAATCEGPIPPVKVRLDDRNQFSPSGRISYEIYPGIKQRKSGSLLELVTGSSGSSENEPVDGDESTRRKRRIVQPTIAIVGQASNVKGSERQPVVAGRRVELGGITIPGPALVKVNAENTSGYLAARGGVRVYDMLSLEAILGVGLDSTEVRLRSPGFDTSDQDLRAAFVIGARITLRPISLFDLYGEITVRAMGDTQVLDREAGLELNLTRNVSLYSGYRWWDYSEDEMASGSDVKLDIDGPTAGLSLKF